MTDFCHLYNENLVNLSLARHQKIVTVVISSYEGKKLMLFARPTSKKTIGQKKLDAKNIDEKKTMGFARKFD